MDEGKFRLTITAEVRETSKYGMGKQLAVREFSVIADGLADLHALAMLSQDFTRTLPGAVVEDAITEVEEDAARLEAAQAMKADDDK